MNYEAFVISCLKDYPSKSVSLINLRDEVAELKARQTSIRSSRSDKEMVQGTNTNRTQEAALNIIALIDEKTAIYTRNKRELCRIERALGILNKDERAVLEAFFIKPVTDPVQYLKEARGYERTWVYDKRREGIRSFAKAYYGAVDT
jgi:hypothetical protein